MANPLDRSQKSAHRTNKELALILARMGTKAHPRGAVLTLYRRIIKSVNAAYAGGDLDRSLFQQAMIDLERESNAITRDAIVDGQNLGADAAAQQLDYYGVASDARAVNLQNTALAIDAASLTVAQQVALARSLAFNGADKTQIIGDRARQGVLRPAPVIDRNFLGVVDITNGAAADVTVATGVYFQRQAIAATDRRTTDTCLRVNGQIVEMDEPFHLVGTPRFQDDMMRPPFHNYCRTVWALYQASFDTGLTANLKIEGQNELGRRFRADQ